MDPGFANNFETCVFPFNKIALLSLLPWCPTSCCRLSIPTVVFNGCLCNFWKKIHCAFERVTDCVLDAPVGCWVGRRALRTRTGTLLWDVGLAGSGLIGCTKKLAPCTLIELTGCLDFFPHFLLVISSSVNSCSHVFTYLCYCFEE